MADKPKSNSNQKLPSNWNANGVSQGKKTGPVRSSPDAYQGKPGSGKRG